MKNNTESLFDPGLQRIIRNFIRIQLLLFPIAGVWRHNSVWNGRPVIGFHMVVLCLLYVYLSSAWLQRRLARWYFILIWVLFVVEGPLAQIVGLKLRSLDQSELSEIVAIQANLYAAVQLIPVIVIAWKKGFKAVLGFGLAAVFSSLVITGAGLGFETIANHFYVQTMIFHLFMFTAIGYVVHYLAQIGREQRQELETANAKLSALAGTLEELVITRERSRLARELHDTLAHVQSGVAVQLEAVDTLWDTNPEYARQLLQKSLVSVRSGMSETRRALQALRARPLETQTLIVAIRNYALQKAAHNDFELVLYLSDVIADLSDEVEQAIYRIVQESLTNIEKHAQAKHVSINLSVTNRLLELRICDDGRGFIQDKIDTRTSFGIRGIQEWADLIHGALHIHSNVGQGTEINLRVAVQ